METIRIEGLRKTYRIYRKREGLKASIKGLFRREYRTVEAVRGIDLSVYQGEFVAFLGPNGAGKTTTLKLLSGVISPTSGTARVLGHIPWRRENAYRRRFALVMGQKNQLWWDLPAQESFRLHQQIYRIDPHTNCLVILNCTANEMTNGGRVDNRLSQRAGIGQADLSPPRSRTLCISPNDHVLYMPSRRISPHESLPHPSL